MDGSVVLPENFSRFYFRQSRLIIAGGFFIVGLNYFLSDLYPPDTFGLSPVIPLGVLWAERGVIMPFSFMIAIMLAVWGERRWMEWVVLFGGLAVGCAMVAGRRFWQASGGDFSVDYSVYLPCGLAALTAFGPRIWILAAPMLLLDLVTAYTVRGATPAAHFEAIGIVAAATVVAAINWQLRRVLALIWDERKYFESLSLIDPLTRLYNRRAFEQRADALLQQAIRDRTPIAVVMVDLDCFKLYNDHYGHPAGDQVLRSIAETLTTHNRRAVDLVARMGGEEFACLWHGVSLDSARQLAETLTERIRELGIEHRASTVGEMVTASVGLRHGVPQRGQTLEFLVEQADAALYAAKVQGRNRAIVAPP